MVIKFFSQSFILEILVPKSKHFLFINPSLCSNSSIRICLKYKLKLDRYVECFRHKETIQKVYLFLKKKRNNKANNCWLS